MPQVYQEKASCNPGQSTLFLRGTHEWVQINHPMFGRGNPPFARENSAPILQKAGLKPVARWWHTFCCHPRVWFYFKGGHWKYSLETLLNLSQRMKQNIKQITSSHTNVAKNRAEFRQKPKYCDQVINCNDANLRDAPAARWAPCTVERRAGTWPAGGYQRRTNPAPSTVNFEGSPVLLGPRSPLEGQPAGPGPTQILPRVIRGSRTTWQPHPKAVWGGGGTITAPIIKEKNSPKELFLIELTISKWM